MDLKEARSYLNYLLTLNIRGEEAFGPMAMTFISSRLLEKSTADKNNNMILGVISVKPGRMITMAPRNPTPSAAQRQGFDFSPRKTMAPTMAKS